LSLHASFPKFQIKEKKMTSRRISYRVAVILLIATTLLYSCTPAATETMAPTEGAVTAPTAMVEPTEMAEPTATEAAMEPTATEAAGETEMAPTTAAGGGEGVVEVFSWWVGPGEADGLNAMVEVFNEMYPDITFENAAVAGGAGTNARAVLATRLSAGDPPDSWQAHAGQEIIGTYVAANQVAPLDDFFAEQGFTDALPPSLLPLISDDGSPYSVPVNIHRSNVMWYNPQVLADNGVTVPTTYEEFFAACDTIQAAGLDCLALGPQWTAMHLFENVLLGTLGVEAYNGLWSGDTDWNSAEVTEAIDNFARTLEYVNSDHASLSDWQPAAMLVVNGDAAFNIMGDWAYGYFANPPPNGLDLTPQEDFDWAPPPGTDGVFMFLADSFVLPANSDNIEATNAWLTVAASREGQEAFNPLKGSICARTDCDPSLFSEYSQQAAEDWASNEVVGSLTHGVTASDAWKTEIDTALALFVADPTGVEDFQQALAEACVTEGVCQ
jgi:glucose/mannose transport system substrate-binding protein